MEEDNKGKFKAQLAQIETDEKNGQGSQPETSESSELDLLSQQSSRRPFTTLSQEDSDLALARALQEQERAYMLLRMNAEPSEHGTSGSGSCDHEDYINDSGENEEDEIQKQLKGRVFK